MWKQKLRIYKIKRKERHYLQKYARKKEPWIEQKFAQKVPEKLQSTLESAFIKAFDLIFSKGIFWIEKTYKKETFTQTTWKRNRKDTKRIAHHHVLGAGISGAGLGLLGIGLPDIFLYTALLLRNLYQIALQNGFSYNTPEEKIFILLLLQATFCSGDELINVHDKLHHRQSLVLEAEIKKTAYQMSHTLLTLKFVQGIPLVGSITGVYDALYMHRLSKYAQIQYEKRNLYNNIDRKIN